MENEIMSTSEALLKLADGIDKLASSIEASEAAVKTASDSSMDYGTLAGASAAAAADPLTAFCLGN